jgi:hypothetical protein
MWLSKAVVTSGRGQKETESRFCMCRVCFCFVHAPPDVERNGIWSTSECLTDRRHTSWILADWFKAQVDLRNTPAFPKSPEFASTKEWIRRHGPGRAWWGA